VERKVGANFMGEPEGGGGGASCSSGPENGGVSGEVRKVLRQAFNTEEQKMSFSFKSCA
jgi:hypothetical protein